jgi:HEXXH motif-containing protein
MVVYHRIAGAELDLLAAGGGDSTTIRRLFAGEYSRRVLLLRHLLDLAPAGYPPAEVRRVWDDIVRLDRTARHEFQLVLMHPPVGTWLSSTIRALHGHADFGLPPSAELRQIDALLFAVAARAGVTLSVRIPLRDRRLLLPTLGMATFGDGSPSGLAECTTSREQTVLRYGRDEIRLTPDHLRDQPGWWTLRRLTASDGRRDISVWLDDLDPYRDLSMAVPPNRLSPEAVRRWDMLLDDAWRLLRESWDRYAEALASGLMLISPLAADPRADVTRSASTGDAFGAALISMPSNGATLAATLVHEFQHIKLGALQHLFRMFREGEESRGAHYAPWRDDPRPIGGLTQGAFAFLGIAEFWQRNSPNSSGAAHQLAYFEHAYAYLQTKQALRALLTSGQLTPLGQRFVQGMRQHIRTIYPANVPRELRRAALAAAADHRMVWRLRNWTVTPESVEATVRAWRRADISPAMIESATSPVAPGQWHHPRIALLRSKIGTPSRFAGITSEPNRASSHVVGATEADVLLVAHGSSHAAAQQFRAKVGADPDDIAAWAGLGIALTHAGDRAWRVWVRAPHIVRSVHVALLEEGVPADPVLIAQWLEDREATRRSNGPAPRR